MRRSLCSRRQRSQWRAAAIRWLACLLALLASLKGRSAEVELSAMMLLCEVHCAMLELKLLRPLIGAPLDPASTDAYLRMPIATYIGHLS